MRYLAEHWTFDPFIVVVAAVVVLHEIGLANLRRRSTPARSRTRRHRSYLFYAGLVLLVVAVASPIDYWSDQYFYVHMVEHILLAFFAPMLIVGGAPWLPLVHGLPVGIRRRWGRALLLGSGSSAVRAVGRFITNPWTALVSFNAVMVVWHLPALFDAAQQNSAIHIWLMHASLFLTGVLFWLQIIPSYPFRMKPSAVWQMGAIIGTNIAMFVLAMAMSIFTATSWYSVYAHVPGVSLSPFADQQLGAAILWVCGDFWAIPALVVVMRRVLDQEGSLSDVADRLLHRAPESASFGQTRGAG
jgi:cytochrome c oxidase assembly factor CtaG